MSGRLAQRRAHCHSLVPMPHSPVPSARFLLRPARADDLPALLRFAAAAPVGLTTLHQDSAYLAARLARSQAAFAADLTDGSELYLFVLVDLQADTVAGVAGIEAHAGREGPYWCLRREAGAPSGPALQLCADLSDATLLVSFHVEPALAKGVAPQLLSRARLLFIAQHAERFGTRIASAHPGIADAGGSAFWDGFGRRFCEVDYATIEQLCGGRSAPLIPRMLPPAAVPQALLAAPASAALGRLHAIAELPHAILVDEGFDTDTHVDAFDGGPLVHERLAMLKTPASARVLAARCGEPGDGGWHLVANCALGGFRATVVQARPGASGITLDAATLRALAVAPGAPLRVAPLDAPWGLA